MIKALNERLKSEVTLEALPKRGVYTLLIHLLKDVELYVGGLGLQKFRSGFYAYTGSALGPSPRSLRLRVMRHLKRDKTARWHVDYLLAEGSSIIAIVVAASAERGAECEVNKLIIDRLKGEPIIKGFGSSDCRLRCKSHLLYLKKGMDVKRQLAEVYEGKFNEASILTLTSAINE